MWGSAVVLGPVAWAPPAPIPLVGPRCCAGFPSPADDFIEKEIDLNDLLIENRPATYLVRVAGDSMTGARLFDGDLAVVNRALIPQSGDVVVVDVNGERSFKVWLVEENRARLAFANPAYPAFDPGPDPDITIWGVVSSSISPRRAYRR
jgi:DNA polymerase V